MKMAICAFLIGIALTVVRQGDSPRPLAAPLSEERTWPVAFEGRALTPMALSEQEEVFAKEFPGALAKFVDADGREVILRYVTKATRKLHPSSDCFRASGFAIREEGRGEFEGTEWRTYGASRGDEEFRVREQIREAEGSRTWTEVSEWWWDASTGGAAQGWLAVTVAERR